MKVIFAYIIAFASLTALLAGPPGPHGWSQPRVETKAPELYAEWWAPTTIAVTEIEQGGLYFPLIVQLRTYAKTNFGYVVISSTNATSNWVNIQSTTNLVIYHVLGYFDGTNAVELLEIEKPQTK